MYGQFEWKASVRASVFHAMKQLLQSRPISDQPLALMLEPALRQFRLLKIPMAAVDDLVHLSAEIENGGQLASAVLRRLGGSRDAGQIQHHHLEQLIRDCETAILDLHPNLREELRLRIRPLREQWEARGPGLMAAVGSLIRTDTRTAGTAGTAAIMVHPVLGGAGFAHPGHRSVCIEAVLANAFHELPEVVRIGWLLSQQICMQSGHADGWGPAYVLQLALVPACLQAAEQVELTRFDVKSLSLALQHWHIRVPDGPDVDNVLMAWWEERETWASWPDGVRVLESRLG